MAKSFVNDNIYSIVIVFKLIKVLIMLHLPCICIVRNLKFATYLEFATSGNTNKINELK